MIWLITASFFLLLVYLILIGFYRWGWVGMPEFFIQPRPQNTYTTTVAVIVPARNETVNVANCIRSILAQTYPQHLLEIMIVDDHSTDDTAQIAQALSLAYTHVHFLPLTEAQTHLAFKKKAIEVGIKNTTGKLIITTDADCTHPTTWIETLVQYHEQTNANFIAAPVVFKTTNKLLSVFQTLDFITMQGITGASVFKHFHTMCNGANLAYTRQAFGQVNGFEGIDKIPTGDDMLLMYKIYKLDKAKVAYLKSKNAIATTNPEYSWDAFLQQRIRWASKATHYKDKRIFITLLLVYLFNFSFLIAIVGSFFSLKLLLTLGLMLAIKTMVEYWFLKPVAYFFNKEKWLIWFAFLQPLHIFYIVVSGWFGKFGKYRWKGRIIPRTGVMG